MVASTYTLNHHLKLSLEKGSAVECGPFTELSMDFPAPGSRWASKDHSGEVWSTCSLLGFCFPAFPGSWNGILSQGKIGNSALTVGSGILYPGAEGNVGSVKAFLAQLWGPVSSWALGKGPPALPGRSFSILPRSKVCPFLREWISQPRGSLDPWTGSCPAWKREQRLSFKCLLLWKPWKNNNGNKESLSEIF